jgi:hypothetical protein
MRDHILGQFFGDSEHFLASPHFVPDIVRMDAGVGPKNHEIVEKIGAFADHSIGLAVHSVDHDLDRLFAEFLGDFGAA